MSHPGVSNWGQVVAILAAAKPHARGSQGRQTSVTSKTKSRAKVLNEGLALARGKSGGIGTGLPEYASLDPIRLDPDYLAVKNLLRDFEHPFKWKDRPDASDHEDVEP